jgi:BirA family biotin operon repressor/biotin-[acetyl-CoA-carboxylase] ligase
MSANTLLITLSDTTSTNGALARMAREEYVPEFTMLTAPYQTQGRGQGDHTWESEPGKNLLISTLWRPEFVPPRDQFRISMAVSLAVLDVVATEVSGATIKWPNDIYIGDRKVAGILIEHTCSGSKLQHSIIGIGLNLNQEQFSAHIPNPVSLRQVTGQYFTSEAIIDRLSSSLHTRYQQMQLRPGLQKKEYQRHLYRLGVWTTYEHEGVVFEGKIVDVNNFGWLMVDTPDGRIRSFAHKEIQFL